jgi:aminoglycoside phosphotransferase (APT) family kinase protein
VTAPAQPKLLASGRWNRVWLSGDGDVVIKRYSQPASAANEAAALRLLADAEIPAPRLLGLEIHPEYAVLRMSVVAGHPADGSTALRLAADLLPAVHAVEGSWYGRLAGGERHSAWTAYLASRVGLYGSVIGAEPELVAAVPGAEHFEALLARIARVPVAPRLLHNDLHQAQFLRVAGHGALLDWEFAVFGDPLFDLARFGVRAGLNEAGVAALAERTLPSSREPDDLVDLTRCYRHIALLTHVSLGVGKPEYHPHRRECRQALAEFAADRTPS